MSRPSAVCRLSVTLLRRTKRVELFGIIFARLIAYGLRQFVLKFWPKKSNRFQVIVQVKWKGVWKIGVFRPIYCFISKTAQVTIKDEQQLVFDVSNGAIFDIKYGIDGTRLIETYLGQKRITTPWAINTCHSIFVHNFEKCWPILTRSSAIAERPRDASCHWIFCKSLKVHSRSFEMLMLRMACVSPY